MFADYDDDDMQTDRQTDTHTSVRLPYVDHKMVRKNKNSGLEYK